MPKQTATRISTAPDISRRSMVLEAASTAHVNGGGLDVARTVGAPALGRFSSQPHSAWNGLSEVFSMAQGLVGDISQYKAIKGQLDERTGQENFDANPEAPPALPENEHYMRGWNGAKGKGLAVTMEKEAMELLELYKFEPEVYKAEMDKLLAKYRPEDADPIYLAAFNQNAQERIKRLMGRSSTFMGEYAGSTGLKDGELGEYNPTLEKYPEYIKSYNHGLGLKAHRQYVDILTQGKVDGRDLDRDAFNEWAAEEYNKIIETLDSDEARDAFALSAIKTDNQNDIEMAKEEHRLGIEETKADMAAELNAGMDSVMNSAALSLGLPLGDLTGTADGIRKMRSFHLTDGGAAAQQMVRDVYAKVRQLGKDRGWAKDKVNDYAMRLVGTYALTHYSPGFVEALDEPIDGVVPADWDRELYDRLRGSTDRAATAREQFLRNEARLEKQDKNDEVLASFGAERNRLIVMERELQAMPDGPERAAKQLEYNNAYKGLLDSFATSSNVEGMSADTQGRLLNMLNTSHRTVPSQADEAEFRRLMMSPDPDAISKMIAFAADHVDGLSDQTREFAFRLKQGKDSRREALAQAAISAEVDVFVQGWKNQIPARTDLDLMGGAKPGIDPAWSEVDRIIKETGVRAAKALHEVALELGHYPSTPEERKPIMDVLKEQEAKLYKAREAIPKKDDKGEPVGAASEAADKASKRVGIQPARAAEVLRAGDRLRSSNPNEVASGLTELAAAGLDPEKVEQTLSASPVTAAQAKSAASVLRFDDTDRKLGREAAPASADHIGVVNGFVRKDQSLMAVAGMTGHTEAMVAAGSRVTQEALFTAAEGGLLPDLWHVNKSGDYANALLESATTASGRGESHLRMAWANKLADGDPQAQVMLPLAAYYDSLVNDLAPSQIELRDAGKGAIKTTLIKMGRDALGDDVTWTRTELRLAEKLREHANELAKSDTTGIGVVLARSLKEGGALVPGWETKLYDEKHAASLDAVRSVELETAGMTVRTAVMTEQELVEAALKDVEPTGPVDAVRLSRDEFAAKYDTAAGPLYNAYLSLDGEGRAKLITALEAGDRLAGQLKYLDHSDTRAQEIMETFPAELYKEFGKVEVERDPVIGQAQGMVAARQSILDAALQEQRDLPAWDIKGLTPAADKVRNARRALRKEKEKLLRLLAERKKK